MRLPFLSKGHALCAALLTLSLASGCGSESTISDARFQMGLGQVDKAEAILGATPGVAADKMRREIEEVRAHRVEVQASLDWIATKAGEEGVRFVEGELRKLLRGEKDRVARDWIETHLSDSADWAASRGQELALQKKNAAIAAALLADDEDDEPESVFRGTVDEPMLAYIIGDARKAIDERRWIDALGVIEMAITDVPAAAPRLDAVRRDTVDMGIGDGEEVIERASEIETEQGLRAAHEYIQAQKGRFPSTGALGLVAREARDIEGRFEILVDLEDSAESAADAAADARIEAREEALANVDPIENSVQAVRALAEGRLADANELWSSAAQASPDGASRDSYKGRAFAAECRLRFRQELAVAFTGDPAPFAELGFTKVDLSLVTLNGHEVSWSSLPASNVISLAGKVELTEAGQVGLLFERIALGDERALVALQRPLDRGWIESADLWCVLADHFGEKIPDGGYTLKDGAWLSSYEMQRELVGEEIAAVAKSFISAKPTEKSNGRDAVYAKFVELADEYELAEVELGIAAEARWKKACAALDRGRTLSALEDIAKQRVKLDKARTHALDLIFDEEEYFYPYRPPACPSEKARLYPAVQREVDVRVESLRDAWAKGNKTVSLPDTFLTGLEEIDWLRGIQKNVGIVLKLPEDVPAWIDALDREGAEVTLGTFAWNQRELARLEQDLIVRAFNERQWAALDGNGARIAGTMEQDQVMLTNDYRVMFGRRVLAWNPSIQEAAQGHSRWMSDTGKFQHFNDEDPTRQSPGDRMRLAGYTRGISENLHMGGGGPEGAHHGWAHSSGHHRNLLMEGHREMATSNESMYWTQNFGVGTDFTRELDRWPH